VNCNQLIFCTEQNELFSTKSLYILLFLVILNALLVQSSGHRQSRNCFYGNGNVKEQLV
jgi:hypothetical protein